MTTTTPSVFGCSPRIAAKLARCAGIAARQLHLTRSRCVPLLTDNDRSILVQRTDGRGMPWLPRARYLAALNAAAVAILATVAGSATAADCGDKFPGQIREGNMSGAAQRRMVHLDATIGLLPYGAVYRERAEDAPRSVYVLIPTDDGKGQVMSASKAATAFYRSRRDCGIFETKAAAEAAIALIGRQ